MGGRVCTLGARVKVYLWKSYLNSKDFNGKLSLIRGTHPKNVKNVLKIIETLKSVQGFPGIDFYFSLFGAQNYVHD